MCVIIQFQPKQMIEKEKLVNACFNNWHSYGLVTIADGKLDIKREVPKDGEVDGEKLFELLQKDFEYERFLHVRHNTAGATNLENTHPFDVYFDPKTGEQVVFMHNGTLYSYKSKKTLPSGSIVDDDEGPSDTKNFVDQVLIPYTQADFGSGRGNIENDHFRKLVRKFWPDTGSNRGVLISAKKPAFFVGDWKFIGETGDQLKVSNDDYFDKVIRGPEAERRRLREEEERKRKEEAQRKAAPKANSSSKSSRIIAPYKSFAGKIEQPSAKFYELDAELSGLTTDWDFYDRQNMKAVGYATKEELEGLYSSKTDCLIVMDTVFTEFTKVCEELESLQEKAKKQEEHIEKMAKEIKAEKGKAA